MRTSEAIGAREIVASGALTLGWRDDVASVTLEDLVFLWSFVDGPDAANLEVEVPSPKIVRFTIKGQLPLGGTAWSFTEVARFRGRSLQLAFSAAQFVALEQGSSVSLRRLTYTFSVEPS